MSKEIRRTEQDRIIRLCGEFLPDLASDRLCHYLINRFISEQPDVNKICLPLDWWKIRGWEIEGKKEFEPQVASIYRQLDPEYTYFTVADERQCFNHLLPGNVVLYCGGGFPSERIAYRKIPLLHSTTFPTLIYPEYERSIFALYSVGRQFDFRKRIHDVVDKHPKFLSILPHISQEAFYYLLSRSMFALAPRGFGPTSYRFYETLFYGAIPVYVSDTFFCPYEDEIDYGQFCVRVTFDEIERLPDILESISPQQVRQMQESVRHYVAEYLPPDKVYQRLVKGLL